jgi:hypothetical protein
MGCSDAFFMDRDLRRHLRSAHKWEDGDITEKMLERDALQGGEFWVRRSDDFVFESAETSIPQTPDLSQDSAGRQFEGGFKDSHIDPSLDAPFDQMKLASLMEVDEEADMDLDMGLDALQTWNMENGLPGA